MFTDLNSEAPRRMISDHTSQKNCTFPAVGIAIVEYSPMLDLVRAQNTVAPAIGYCKSNVEPVIPVATTVPLSQLDPARISYEVPLDGALSQINTTSVVVSLSSAKPRGLGGVRGAKTKSTRADHCVGWLELNARIE